MAESYLILGRVADSLASYKYLLFFMPQDQEISNLVQEIETRAYEDGALVLQNDPIPLKSYSIKAANDAISSDPTVRKGEWIKRVELLQGLLIRVQTFKLANRP